MLNSQRGPVRRTSGQRTGRQRSRRGGWNSVLGLLLLLAASVRPLRADVGLIVETPTGILGFLSNVGHVSVWISHGCLDAHGAVYFCEGSPGVVLTSTAYWSNPGAAAIPAKLYFLGSEPGTVGRGTVAWTSTLAGAYPGIQASVGDKYFGRVWLRGMRVLTFKTSPEQDRQALAQVEAQRQIYRYSYSHHNCAFYAEQVLKLYLGNDFRANRILEFGIETPRALERALRHRLASDPTASYRTVTFRGSRMHSWRQPPRSICESAIFDPKYAIPLAFYQPYLYVGFAACYLVSRVLARDGGQTSSASLSPTPPEWPSSDAHIAAFRSLTGGLPVGSGWETSPAPPPQTER